jgi:hypothetical protein
MKIEIENYRGHTIEYDDERDRFYCEMAIGDAYQQKERKSLAEVRKQVDLFIKANLEFKPFKVMSAIGDVVEIVSIRTDGKFVDSNRNQYNRADIITASRYGTQSRGYYYDGEIIEKLKALKELEEKQRQEIMDARKKLIQSATLLPDDFLSEYVTKNNKA